MHASVRTSARKTAALSFLIAAAAFGSLFVGCAINPESRGKDALTETACNESVKVFDTTGLTAILLEDLPAGIYQHQSAEIYVQSKFSLADGTFDVSQVQFLETPDANSSPQTFSTALRCREIDGNFHSYFTQPAMISDFTRLNSGDFDVSSLAYAVTFQTESSPFMTVNQAGSQRSTPSGTLASTIGGFWNSNYLFASRAGGVFEFYGVRVEPGTGRTIFGKSVFLRSDLPANSI